MGIKLIGGSVELGVFEGRVLEDYEDMKILIQDVRNFPPEDKLLYIVRLIVKLEELKIEGMPETTATLLEMVCSELCNMLPSARVEYWKYLKATRGY